MNVIQPYGVNLNVQGPDGADGVASASLRDDRLEAWGTEVWANAGNAPNSANAMPAFRPILRKYTVDLPPEPTMRSLFDRRLAVTDEAFRQGLPA
jgi:hypothetical protein